MRLHLPISVGLLAAVVVTQATAISLPALDSRSQEKRDAPRLMGGRPDLEAISNYFRLPLGSLAPIPGHISAYSDQAGCATSLLHNTEMTCGRVGSADAETSRIRTAIGLTLCSLQSARQPFLRDCLALLQGGANQYDQIARERCLEELHRSPQDWTTYTSFLADATKLCHAIQGEQQARLALTTYANITNEKLDLLRMLKSHEMDSRQWWTGAQSQLEDEVEGLRTLRNALTNELDKHVVQLEGSLSTSQHQLADWAEEWLAISARHSSVFWAEMRQEAGDWTSAVKMDYEDVLVTAHRAAVQAVASELIGLEREVSNQLYSSLEAQNKAALSFVGDLEVRVGGAADQAVAVLTNAHSVANELRETVASMIGELAVAGVSAADLALSLQSGSAAAARIANMQASQLQSLEKTTLLQAQQKNASHAALELADETLEAIHRLRYAVGVNNLFQLSSIRVLPLIYRIGASLLPLGSESSTGPLFRAIAVAIDFCLNALIGVCTLAIYLFSSVWLLLRSGIKRQAGAKPSVRTHDEMEGSAGVLSLEQWSSRRLNFAAIPPVSHPHQAPAPCPRQRYISRSRQLDLWRRRAQSEPPLGF